MLEVGEKAPSFQLRDLEGQEQSSAGILASGPAIFAFYKTTCPTCQFTFPFLERLRKHSDVPIYGISQDNRETTLEFNEEFGVTFPTLLDPKPEYQASNGFAITHVPSIFVVEKDGTVSFASDGFSRRDLESLGRRVGVEIFQPGEYVPEWKAG